MEHNDFFATLGAPAQRALQNAGILTLQDFCGFTRSEIFALHGIGQNTLGKIEIKLKEAGLAFKSE